MPSATEQRSVLAVGAHVLTPPFLIWREPSWEQGHMLILLGFTLSWLSWSYSLRIPDSHNFMLTFYLAPEIIMCCIIAVSEVTAPGQESLFIRFSIILWRNCQSYSPRATTPFPASHRFLHKWEHMALHTFAHQYPLNLLHDE